MSIGSPSTRNEIGDIVGKSTSCGVVIVDPAARLFVCRTTGRGRWDLPKGIAEPGEAPRDAAVREAWEETSLQLDPTALTELGVFDYLPAKKLHLFAVCVAPDAFATADCRCHSYFEDERSGRRMPEVDAYAWRPIAELDAWCGKNLTRVLRGLDWNRLTALPPLRTVPLRD